MSNQSEVLMLQGCFQAEHAKGLILKLIKDKIQVQLRSIAGNSRGEDYLQYDEERRLTVEDEVKIALDRICGKRVNLHAIIVVDPLVD